MPKQSNTQDWLNTPLSSLQSIVGEDADGLISGDLMETERELTALSIRAARVATYISMRHGGGCGDQGHSAAVKEQNKIVREVRKALGYTYPEQNIQF